MSDEECQDSNFTHALTRNIPNPKVRKVFKILKLEKATMRHRSPVFWSRVALSPENIPIVDNWQINFGNNDFCSLLQWLYQISLNPPHRTCKTPERWIVFGLCHLDVPNVQSNIYAAIQSRWFKDGMTVRFLLFLTDNIWDKYLFNLFYACMYIHTCMHKVTDLPSVFQSFTFRFWLSIRSNTHWGI